MKPDITAQRQFWEAFYEDVLVNGPSWIDHADARWQAHTYALTLEGAGVVIEKMCLDVGCGKGQFAKALHAFGARKVVAVDLVETTIRELQRTVPEIQWMSADVCNPETWGGVPAAEVVFAIEILQYVPLVPALPALWEKVMPGGRLVGMVPNGANRYVLNTVEKFQGLYAPPTGPILNQALEQLPDLDYHALRPLFWGEDQRIVPYDARPWMSSANWAEEPKRILFVANKRSP